MRRLSVHLISVTLCLCGCLVGCSTTSVRPPALVTRASLPRPVVVIGGFTDPFVGATHVARWIRANGKDQRVLAVSPGLALSFDGAAEQVTRAVSRAFPSDDPTQTVEVDVIGLSMGGVVARHAAAPGGHFDGPRLNVRRLYTLAAPHSGAIAANRFGFLGTAAAMRSGSAFLRRLAGRERRDDGFSDYPIVQYARDHDLTVGRDGVAMADHLNGQTIWLDAPWYVPGHLLIFSDERILKDIVRRLRARPTTAPNALRALDGLELEPSIPCRARSCQPASAGGAASRPRTATSCACR